MRIFNRQTSSENTKFAVLAAILIFSGSASAQKAKDTKAAAPAPAEKAEAERTSDKMDIKSLEKKYWSAKDDDFSVVQNRAYSKSQRFFISAIGGSLINDSYSVGSGINASVGYYFSERWGLEFSHLQTSLNGNDSTKEFLNRYKVAPNHNQTQSVQTLSAHWMPIYGKISLLDSKIVYYDMGLGLGVGQTNYEQQVVEGGFKKAATHYSVDVIQQYFFNEHFAVRVDFKNQWSTQKRVRYHQSTTDKTRDISDGKTQNTFLMLGFTFFVP